MSEKKSKSKTKISKVLNEYKNSELHAGSKTGKIITSQKQATAIALSEARKSGSKNKKKGK